jgi:tryptophan-rich sensory protein
MTTQRPAKDQVKFGALSVAAVASASFIDQLATRPNLEPWYAGLAKPLFNPPNWVFAPVWTFLYILMAVALWRILCLPADTPGRRLGLALFFVQLGMNAAWSWMFFGAQSPLLGMINILPQLIVIIVTVGAFRRLDKAAAGCLVPLAAWVGFASLLNFEILRLNG